MINYKKPDEFIVFLCWQTFSRRQAGLHEPLPHSALSFVRLLGVSSLIDADVDALKKQGSVRSCLLAGCVCFRATDDTSEAVIVKLRMFDIF